MNQTSDELEILYKLYSINLENSNKICQDNVNFGLF